LKEKALLEINDLPIFAHVFNRVIEAGLAFEDIVLATDDVKIEDKAMQLKIPVVMTSKSHASGTDRINEVAQTLNWSPDTLVVNVQGDEPLIPNKLISGLIEFANLRNEFDITTAVTPIKSEVDFVNPNVVKAIVAHTSRALYFTRASAPVNRFQKDDFSHAFKHIGIYAYRVQALNKMCSFPEAELEQLEKLEQLRALSNGMTMGAMVFEGEVPHGVDTEDDYLITKGILENHEHD
jgi:3-deoxy-manno-octulosonate cytidylyltransferase (CMP-KDO synthetase)